jgi:predicted  nucleic acid-binding Zn-ribbon protein
MSVIDSSVGLSMIKSAVKKGNERILEERNRAQNLRYELDKASRMVLEYNKKNKDLEQQLVTMSRASAQTKKTGSGEINEQEFAKIIVFAAAEELKSILTPEETSQYEILMKEKGF